jgi:EAL domain-containing protein (putative c-di-GMP-specific phosphodiesterase class I)
LLSDQSLHHYEGLIRPKPIPGCPFAGPQDFVMLVEALGLAHELDLAVARRACDAAVAADVQIAFNVSSQSAQSCGFRDRLLDLLAASAASKAGLVSIEMTETAEIDNVREAARTAEALRAAGVPFCMDDFGAGSADVRLLRALGADLVKLDGSYVRGVAQPGRERAFVAGMVEIARAAGAEIVAEHVETPDEADALLSMGVRYGQGWLFGRPGPLPKSGSTTQAGIGRSPGVAKRRGLVRESWG